jgi:endonuclease/exonuclease/phosphatase family metal-dependent hydrolase
MLEVTMRTFLTCVFLAALAGGCGSSGEKKIELRVMTYNILVDLDNPDYDPWTDRREGIADTIRRHDPDLVGLQEPIQGQVDDLLGMCPGYSAVHQDKGFTDATILYRTARFSEGKMNIYWLSPTPEEEYSLGFGNILPRMVIRVVLKDRAAGRSFYFITTHFDNTAPSQDRSAPLFLERTEPLAAKLPVVITGDFNSDLDSSAYAMLANGTGSSSFRLINAFDLAPDWSMDTNVDPPPDYDTDRRIDHIFLAGGQFACDHWAVDVTTYPPNDRYPSDHFAMAADLAF